MSQQEPEQPVWNPLPKMRELSSDEGLSLIQTKNYAESLLPRLAQVMDMIGSDLSPDTLSRLNYDIGEFADKMAAYQFMTNRDCTDLEKELEEAIHHTKNQISELQDIRPLPKHIDEYLGAIPATTFRAERLVVALSHAVVVASVLSPRTVSQTASIAVSLEYVPRMIRGWFGSIPGGLSPEQNDKLNGLLRLLGGEMEQVRNLNAQLLKSALPSNTPDGMVIA